MPSELHQIESMLRRNPDLDPAFIEAARLELAEQILLPGDAGAMRSLMDREAAGHTDHMYAPHVISGGVNWGAWGRA